MFTKLTSLFFVRPNAAFVPVRDAGVEGLFRAPAATPALAPTQEPAKHFSNARSVTWAPASSQRLRLAESLASVSILAYFGYGLLATLGVF